MTTPELMPWNLPCSMLTKKKLEIYGKAMMTCTVENREKKTSIEFFSKEIFQKANKSFEKQQELQTIIKYLEEKKNNKELNNPGILRMVKTIFTKLL